MQNRRSRGACWVMWHVRCLWEVMCSIGPGSSFNIHCNFGVCRLLSAWDSTGHALRFCSELPVEETLLASMSAKKNGNDFHMEGQRVELGWKRNGWVSPFFPRRQPECLREVTHRPLSGGSMGQFEKETCGSVSAPGKAPKSDTAKWQTDPPRKVGRRF